MKDISLETEFNGLAKHLIDCALSNLYGEESNCGVVCYDYYIDEYPLIEVLIDNDCNYFEEKINEYILKDERVIQCEIDNCVIEIVFKDKCLEKIKKEENDMKKNKIIELGTEVYLTDPCYDTATWCQKLLKSVKSGKWIVDYKFDLDKEETILSLVHTDYDLDMFSDYDGKIEIVDNLGVDSGTIGVFDKEYYEKYHFEDDKNDVWYKKHIIDSDFERELKITDNFGIWSRTTFGDGVYYARIYSKDKEVIGIEVVC